MSQLVDQLQKITEEALPSNEYFIVTIIVSSKANPKISIILDGDKGISIDECAKVSRQVGFIIEEQDLIKDSFRLEVSSPGLDHPLRFKRQYHSRIGRTLELTLLEGEKAEGKLSKVEEESIELIQEVKEKGKKKQEIPISVPFEKIERAMVKASFK